MCCNEIFESPKNKKPALGGLGIFMTEFLLIKAGVIFFLAFEWGLYCGLTGRSLSGESESSNRD